MGESEDGGGDNRLEESRVRVADRLRGYRRRRVWYVTVLMCISGGFVLFSLLALDDVLLYFRVPTDILENPPKVDERLRLGGLVKAGSVERDEGDEGWRFVVSDGETEMSVKFGGVFPDLFREGQGMVAEGYYEGDVFWADLIMAKHDENYVPRTLSGESLYEKGHEGDYGGSGE